ncbi:MAG TPA: hypothetical protein VGK18_13460 [Propionicimonas sp.]|uniref:hypothetical protein n=1 Tax=Propionicimonas sp. TaxID=1955623 RepID=UPI002F3FDBAD
MSGLVAFAPASDAATIDCNALTTPVYNTVNPTVGNQLLTASSSEYKSSISSYGFTEDHGVLGYAASTAVAGTVPVTRMYNGTTNDFLWASSDAQIAAAKLYGYVTQKVNFYAPTSSSSCTAGVHKFSKGDHRRNAVSAADQKALLAAGWKDAGVIFYVKTSTTTTAAATTATPTATATATATPTATATATPTATATSTATATPTTTAAATTTPTYGVPAGTALKVVNGDMTVTTPGTVISGIDLHGYLSIKADNVTVENSILRGGAQATSGKALIMAWWKYKNLKVINSTLKAEFPSIYVDGLSGSNYTAQGLDIYGVVDALKVIGGNTTIRGNYFHDAIHSDNDPTHPDGQTHDDGIQVEGGSAILIENNKIGGFHNSPIQVTQNYAATNGVTIRNNELSGGGCQVNVTSAGAGGAGAPITSFALSGNKFGAGQFGTTCPMRLPKTSSFTVSANTWLATGAVAVPYYF